MHISLFTFFHNIVDCLSGLCNPSINYLTLFVPSGVSQGLLEPLVDIRQRQGSYLFMYLSMYLCTESILFYFLLEATAPASRCVELYLFSAAQLVSPQHNLTL